MLHRANSRVFNRLGGQFDSLPSIRIWERVKGKVSAPGCMWRNGRPSMLLSARLAFAWIRGLFPAQWPPVGSAPAGVGVPHLIFPPSKKTCFPMMR